jgi:hypothetical protein
MSARHKSLRAKAATLFEGFNKAFWDEEFGYGLQPVQLSNRICLAA